MKVALNLIGMGSIWQGGLGVYAGQLAVGLAKRLEADLTVLCPPAVARELDGLTATAQMVEVAELQRRRLRQAVDLLVAASRPSRLRGNRALPADYGLGDSELVHYPLSFMGPPPHKRPTVVTAFDLLHLDRPNAVSRREKMLRRLRWHMALRAADRVIAISGFTRDSLVRHLRIDPSRIDVVHLACHPSFFDSAGEMPADDPGGDFVFYPASAAPHKNHSRLMRAFASVARRHPGLRLVLSTPRVADDWARIEAEAVAAGVGDRVELVGHLSLSELRAHYLRARALVFPSLYEGFGIPLVEAMALGCPVVAARAGSIPEVLAEEGRLFDPRDVEEIASAIEDCITQAESDREREIESGRRHAKRFSVERMADETLRSYERVAGRSRATTRRKVAASSG